MNMRIDNFEDASDLFTFPNNPMVFDDDNQMNLEVKEYPFAKLHYISTGQGIKPKTIVLQGHFNEATSVTKRDDFNELAKHVSEAKLKKVYFENDRFYICLGQNIKQTRSGGRTNFIDYTSSFVTPVSLLFDDTLKTADYNGAWTGGSQTNAGSVETFIEEIEIPLTSNGSGHSLEILDNSNNGLQVKLDSYSGGQTLKIRMISLVNLSAGIKFTELFSAFVDGVQQRVKRVGTDGSFLRLQPGESIDTFTIQNNTANTGDFTFKWRDAYLG